MSPLIPETIFREERERLAKELRENKKITQAMKQKYEIEIDILDWILRVIEDYNRIIEQNKQATT